MKDLTYEINNDYVTYYLKNDKMILLKKFHDFNNGIESFKRIQSSKMKLEEAKNRRVYLNQI